MRKITIAVHLIFIGMLIIPSTYASFSWRTIDDDLVLESVREQRLRDIQNKIQLATLDKSLSFL